MNPPVTAPPRGAPHYAIYSPTETSPVQDPLPVAVALATRLVPAAPQPPRRRRWRAWLAAGGVAAVMVVAGVVGVSLWRGTAVSEPMVAPAPMAEPWVPPIAEPGVPVAGDEAGSVDQAYDRLAGQALSQSEWAVAESLLVQISDPTLRDDAFIQAAEQVANGSVEWGWVHTYLSHVARPVDGEWVQYAEQLQAMGDWSSALDFLSQVKDPTLRDAALIAAAETAANHGASWDWVQAFLNLVSG
jgi:hypothetical protein